MKREKAYVESSRTDLDQISQNGYFNLAKIHLDETGPNLVLACKFGHKRLVDLFLQCGADPHLNDSESVEYACRFGCPEIAQLLLEHGVQVGKIHNLALNYRQLPIIRITSLYIPLGRYTKEHSLRLAITGRSYRLVKFFIQMGADIHDDNEGALRSAGFGQDSRMIKILLRSGADPSKVHSHTRAGQFVHKYVNR